MHIDPAQITNPGIYDHDQKYHDQLSRFMEATRRARFLSEKEKRHWKTLGALLDLNQLKRAESMIIDEDLRLLKTRKALDKIKKKTNSPH